MSLCVQCGLALVGDDVHCSHHIREGVHIEGCTYNGRWEQGVYVTGRCTCWGRVNKVWCDGVHRGAWPEYTRDENPPSE